MMRAKLPVVARADGDDGVAANVGDDGAAAGGSAESKKPSLSTLAGWVENLSRQECEDSAVKTVCCMPARWAAPSLQCTVVTPVGERLQPLIGQEEGDHCQSICFLRGPCL